MVRGALPALFSKHLELVAVDALAARAIVVREIAALGKGRPRGGEGHAWIQPMRNGTHVNWRDIGQSARGSNAAIRGKLN